MSIISKKSFILEEEDDKDYVPYELPKLVTSKPEVISFRMSSTYSTLLHIAVPTLIWLLSIILLLLGINLTLFNKIKPQPKRDIEFVLVDKPGKPRDPNKLSDFFVSSYGGIK